MNYWIFQGNPDRFDIDTYLSRTSKIVWSVRQKNYAPKMLPGDEVFLWRASGKKKAVSGVVAFGHIIEPPQMRPDDSFSKGLWLDRHKDKVDLRVLIDLKVIHTAPKKVVKKDWLQNDPVVHQLPILKMGQQTNYQIKSEEADRLRTLIMNTGRTWTYEESIAGLWAYAQTKGGEVSKLPNKPVSTVALRIGRAVNGVYNKVMNFRYIDETDSRKGFSGGGESDKQAWADFFDADTKQIKIDELEEAFQRAWPISSYKNQPQSLAPKFLRKKVGTSQYTDGVRIDKAFHELFNPPGTSYYVARGESRKVEVIFNGKIFPAEYRYEGTKVSDVVLQRIGFGKELKDEFKSLFPIPAGEFTVSVGEDLNQFVFDHQFASVEDQNQYFQEQVNESSEDDLEKRRARLTSAPKKPSALQITTSSFQRNPDVVAEVLYRANGVCERCKNDAPFKRAKDGTPYLEVHHKITLANGGDDTVENAIALCPNCHREMHFGQI